jgi:predicted nucleic acid-binding protein
MATAVLVDTNVILDIATNDADWCEWSSAALAHAADESVLVINPLFPFARAATSSRDSPSSATPP